MIHYHELPTDIRHKYFDYYAAIVSAYPSYTFLPLTETTFNDDYAPAVQYPCHGLAYYESTGFISQPPADNSGYINKGPKVQQAKIFEAGIHVFYSAGSSFPTFRITSSANTTVAAKKKAMPFIPRSWYTTPAQRALQSLNRQNRFLPDIQLDW